jgi:hypothetical protein
MLIKKLVIFTVLLIVGLCSGCADAEAPAYTAGEMGEQSHIESEANEISGSLTEAENNDNVLENEDSSDIDLDDQYSVASYDPDFEEFIDIL